MFNTDVIKTYIFKPNYYDCEKKFNCEYLQKFNNYILYLYIKIYKSDYFKLKTLKENYIMYSYFSYYENKIIFAKLKKYDNIKIETIDDYEYYKHNYDLRIDNNSIAKKIDINIYIKYYHIKYIINDVSLKAIRRHEFCDSKYNYSKIYITYYINYYIIIYNDIKNNDINKSRKCNNTIFCNYSRNFMLFI